MVTSADKIVDVIKKYPSLKEKLMERNSKFKNLNNPVVFNTVGRFAKISDAANMSGENLDALLAFINVHTRDAQ